MSRMGGCWWLSPLLCLSVLVARPASGQEGPYAGKQVRFFTMGSAGGGYDTYMRTLIPALERRLGAKLVPINESGAGGLIAMQRIVNAPPDGLTIGLMGGEALVTTQLYDLPGVNYDARTLTWIARISAEDKVVITQKGGRLASVAVMLRHDHPVAWGGTGKADGNSDFSAILAAATGMKAKIVLGYKGTPAINLAIESGEIDARVISDESAALFTRAGKLQVATILSRQRSEQFKSVATVFEQAKLSESGARMIEWRAGVAALGRVVLTTPGAPAAQVAALRQAFREVLADAGVIAEIKKRSLAPGYASGEELQAMITRAMTALTPAQLAEVRAVITDRYY